MMCVQRRILSQPVQSPHKLILRRNLLPLVSQTISPATVTSSSLIRLILITCSACKSLDVLCSSVAVMCHQRVPCRWQKGWVDFYHRLVKFTLPNILSWKGSLGTFTLSHCKQWCCSTVESCSCDWKDAEK